MLWVVHVDKAFHVDKRFMKEAISINSEISRLNKF